jgi:N-acetyl-gamma-glutamyl-phosphate reductase
MKTISAGIIGGAGYTGGELIRLLLHHPQASIRFVSSRNQEGKPVYETHADLFSETDLVFSAPGKADVIFLCLGHGESKKWLDENPQPAGTKIIDLSQDFRLNGENGFVYGLPELQKEKIAAAASVANPGCFATAIQLALLPFAKQGLLNDDVQITAVTGSTGAGRALSATSHFSWRYGNHSAYKVLEHQHLAEIGQSISQLQPDFKSALHFVPSRGAFTRGIHAVLHTATSISGKEAQALLADYYSGHPFTHACPSAPGLKQVVNTNKCLVHADVTGGRLVLTSVIDNLLKGASGQAVQNMNLLFGFEENCGLQLKASAY